MRDGLAEYAYAEEVFATMENRKVVLSTAWIFAVLNYIYCDVAGLMDSTVLKQFIEGSIGELEITEGFLLGASILMEIPIAMVLLSRILKYKSNRLANVCAGAIMSVVQISTLFMGSPPTSYYIFFSIIEIACTAFIVWYAWRWPNPDAAAIAT